MKIYHNGRRIRDRRGRFARAKRRGLAFIFILGVAVLGFHYGGGYDALMRYIDTPVIVKTVKVPDEALKKNIEAAKWDIVDKIASCETGRIPEGRRNAQVTMDTNGYYSRGKWQFQLKTVQYYVRKFEGRNISLDEATLIAHDESKARQLAYRIVWDEVGGIYNWHNCAKKLGLKAKIEVIRQLEK